MATKIARIERTTYRGLTTLGRLYGTDGEFLAYTLEDVVRAPGIKDKGRTAIPAGQYNLSITRSQRFGRDMVVLYTEQDKSTLRAGGIEFTGVRMHGGNTHEDSAGCILVAKNAMSPADIKRLADGVPGDLQRKSFIWGSAESAVAAHFAKSLDAGFTVILNVFNLPQNA